MSPVLTMSEYLVQTDPVYMPIVRLKEGEYSVLETYVHKKGTHEEEDRVTIKINQYPDYCYVKRGKDCNLYAVKHDGTLRKSCFWI